MKRLNFFFVFFIIMATMVTSCSKDKDDEKSDQKKIVSFTITSLSPEVTGIIDETAKTITIDGVPSSSVTSLTPTIVVSAKAAISPASATPQDFTNPVVYTVTAEDGSNTTYTVTVHVVNNTETLTGSMSSNRTLTDKGPGIDYIIDGTFYLDGNALLTVDPGVKIVFTGTNGWIEVGENAGLKMVGTAANPIILTGPVNNANKGAWGGIEYHSNRADNQMEYVTVEYAGSNEYYGAITVDDGAKLSVKNCTISNSANYGLWVNGSLSAFSNNTINLCDKAPIRLNYIEKAGVLDTASNIANNAEVFVQIDNSFDNQVDLTLNCLKVPYLFKVGIYAEKNLIVAPGTHILFDDNAYLEISNLGKLTADGTSDKPISFSHAGGETGYWEGIIINTSTGNSMQYCTIEHGGYGYEKSDLTIGDASKISLQNCIIRKSSGYGISRYNTSQITATGVTFSECAEGNVYNVDEDVVSSSL